MALLPLQPLVNPAVEHAMGVGSPVRMASVRLSHTSPPSSGPWNEPPVICTKRRFP
jgi:hypothetical protein